MGPGQSSIDAPAEGGYQPVRVPRLHVMESLRVPGYFGGGNVGRFGRNED
jgi:hypothetical protein